jgi:hypothetical protein
MSEEQVVVAETVVPATKNQKIVITYAGHTLTLREWAQRVNRPYHTLYSRFKVNPDPVHIFKNIGVVSAPGQ